MKKIVIILIVIFKITLYLESIKFCYYADSETDKTFKEIIERYGSVYQTLYYYHIPWLGAFGTKIINKDEYTNFDKKNILNQLNL